MNKCICSHHLARALKRCQTAGACLGLVVVLGCTSGASQSSAQKSLLAVWQSTNSTAPARADAVNKSIAPGTDVESIRKLLGRDGNWTRYHGPTIDLVGRNGGNAGPSGYHDFWQLEYTVSDGLVVLRFVQAPGVSPPRFQFERAFVAKPLTSGKQASKK